MKLHRILLLASLFALTACDDNNQSNTLCDKACGHGSCYYKGTLESCLCETGYLTNEEGSCVVCATDYTDNGKGECVADSVCSGQCRGSHQTCSVVNHKPVCGCAYGYDKNGDSCIPSEDCYTSFHYENVNATGLHVYVTGTMDGWSKNKYLLTETSNGVFEGSFPLDEGQYKYKFYVSEWNDGGWKTNGDENWDDLVVDVIECSQKVVPTIVMDSKPVFTDGNAHVTLKLKDKYDQAQNVVVSVTRDGEEIPVTQDGKTITFDDPVGSEKKVTYMISATSDNGFKFDDIYLPIWNEEKPFDWRDAILYFAFTDRFKDGNPSNNAPLGVDIDWAGGDFAGLKQKVDEGYFDALGVNALWISSVTMNTQSVKYGDGYSMAGYHAYWPIAVGYTDETASIYEGGSSNGVPFTVIEPHFGTFEELQELVSACHNHGIRVLVDFAVNHVDEDSPLWQNHPEWFNYGEKPGDDSILCTGPNQSQQNWNWIPETCWFAPNLPDFNYDIPEVRQFVVDHAKWLIKTTGIDGFRLDAVKHMPEQFIKDLRKGIDELMAFSGQTFYIVGETFDGAWTIKRYIGNDKLHGQFDFPLYNVLRDTIMKGWRDGAEEGKFWNLKDFVAGGDGDGTYGNALMSTFLGNHDVPRAISHIHFDSGEKYGNNPEVFDDWAYLRLKLAWTFLFTSPGLPLIYYGDEYGMEGANDPDNRRMMEFGNALNDQQKSTLEFVQKLGQLRRNHPVLSRGKRQNIDAYARSYMYLMKGEGETILVGISDTDEDQTYTVNEGSKGWINLLNESETITETTSVTLTRDRHIIVWKLKE